MSTTTYKVTVNQKRFVIDPIPVGGASPGDTFAFNRGDSTGTRTITVDKVSDDSELFGVETFAVLQTHTSESPLILTVGTAAAGDYEIKTEKESAADPLTTMKGSIKVVSNQ